jgi:hypothetical protein
MRSASGAGPSGRLSSSGTEGMRRALRLFATLFALGMIANGCATTEEARPRPGDQTSTPSTGSSSTEQAACDKQCRAEREAARCREFLSGVRLHYDITAVPTPGGQEIGLHMTVENRTGARVAGSTSGTLRVAPGPPSNRISWGGSSADELYQKPGTTLRRPVWHDRQPPGWHPVGDTVTSFDFSTYSYAPGPGTTVCYIPATVRAPRGLVAEHPSGRWRQESRR